MEQKKDDRNEHSSDFKSSFCVWELLLVSYSAARRDPVSQSQSRQPNGHRQHHQQFDSHGLLPQAGQVLVPDAEQLLLAVRMSHELEDTKCRESSKTVARERR